MTTIVNWLLGRETEFDPGRNSSVGLLILRVFLGLTMAFGHGWGKLTNFSQVAVSGPRYRGCFRSFSPSSSVRWR